MSRDASIRLYRGLLWLYPLEFREHFAPEICLLLEMCIRDRVNTMLPVWSNGNLVYAQPGPNGGLWLPLLEKGYAQWNETGHEGRDGTNTYAALNSGCMNTVDEQVLGTVATTYSPVAGDLASEQAVIAAIESHEAVTAAIFLSGDPTVFSELGLVSCHAYVIASYDADPNSPTYCLLYTSRCV